MKIHVEEYFTTKKFTDEEKEITNDLFQILPSNVYFYIDVLVEIDEKQIYNFYGMSGDGKTIIKDTIKEKLESSVDFDDIDDSLFYDLTIKEIFDIKDSKQEILKLMSFFGMFEIRYLFSKYQHLSNGQQTRIKYIYLFYKAINENKKYVFIDEFLTFVDSISAINFSTGIKRFLKDKDIKLFCFGVNDIIVSEFEDITYGILNGKCNFIVEKKEDDYYIKYLSDRKRKDSVYFKTQKEKSLIEERKPVKNNLDDLF